MITPHQILEARILIADDQAANVALLEDILRSAGYLSVTSTRDPLVVCELHRIHCFDLILLDLLMPVMDGFQVLEALKAIETDGYLPVLVLTAHPAQKLRALKAGAKDCVSTPFDLAEILARVNNMIEVRLLHLSKNRLYEQIVEEQKISQQLLHVFRSSPAAMSISTVEEGRIIDANEEHCRFFGYSREEISKNSINDRSLWADPDIRKEVIQRLRAEGSMRGFEARQRLRSGEVRDVLTSLELIELAGEEEPVLISMFTDVTPRAIAEEGLRRSQALLRMAGRLSRMGAWSVELPEMKLTFSDEMCAIHGEPPGFSPSLEAGINFYCPEFRQPITDAFNACVRDGTPFDLELQMIVKDRPVWVRSIGEAQRDASGLIRRVQGALQDITERKSSEAELEKTHRELLDTSRLAGMAEVATAVLHNVGNVLNSVNVASSCVAESIRSSKAANLSKIVIMLREHEADLGVFLTEDPKGKQIPGYLALLTDHLTSEQDVVLKELSHLQMNIEHINEIVAMQQGIARVAGATELLSVVDLLEDTLRMSSSALAKGNLTIVKEFDAVPSITAEKHKVLQILVNLMRNAAQSCEQSGQPARQVKLCVSNGGDSVHIAISDNGIGISDENIHRIFAHGFTTKKTGHGFGLHSGALTAKEMGGSLSVKSHGLGRGATFTLVLPIGGERVH